MSKKKLMALLLTGVMAASTVSVPVFARMQTLQKTQLMQQKRLREVLPIHRWLLDRPTSPRNSVECSQKQFRISRSPIS